MTFITSENEILALKIPRVCSAYKLWVNDKLVASAGKVGKTRNDMIPQFIPQVAFFQSHKGKNEIVIQISNFCQRYGGILESIKLGGEKQILELRYKGIAYELFMFGSLIIMGVYHLVLFFFRRKDKTPLYFGLFCILIAARTLLVGESFFTYLFPKFNWEIAHKIQTLTFYIGVPIIIMFFRSVLPEYFNIRVVRMAQFIGAAYGILVISSPSRIFTSINSFYQLWSIFLIAYVLSVFVRIILHKEKDTWLIVSGGLALILTSIMDIISLSACINDSEPSFLKSLFRTDDLSSMGQFVFVVVNSLLLAKGFSRSLKNEEIMSEELTGVNKYLDELVMQRTKALAESNKKIEQQNLQLEKANYNLQQLSLKDPLTGLWNRRKYDKIIKMEWYRCMKQKKPISMLFMDIDYFKKFNDYYGHLAGDECLIKVGETIKNFLSRSTYMVVRYGGEEFVALLPETGKEEAVKIANMLLQKIEKLAIPHKESLVNDYVTLSIGVGYTIPKADSSYEDLLKTADKAVYQAKAAGRNQVKFLKE